MSQKFGPGSTGEFFLVSLAVKHSVKSDGGSNGAASSQMVSFTHSSGAPPFSAPLPFQQASLHLSMQWTQSCNHHPEKASLCTSTFKPLLMFVMFHWPKKVSWPSPNSKSKEINSTSCWEERQSHFAEKHAYVNGRNDYGHLANKPHFFHCEMEIIIYGI